MYTLEDLERARTKLREWNDRFDRYTGNNPDKYQSAIKAALRSVQSIESDLKQRGLVSMTEEEQLYAALNDVFPKVRHKEVVEYKGKRYECRFFPLEKSRSRKSVLVWGKSWRELTTANKS